MNKTANIHIKGVPFILEENAYSILQDYLKRLKISLGNQLGAEEIAEDIELRFAELLSEIIKNNISVIEERHIQEVISILGDPREYATDDSEQVQPEEESAQAVNGTIPVGRSLFRDKENAWLGGVCAGIAVYLNINVILIRLALVLFVMMGGSGILIYLILWIIMPKPKTTLDFLRMRGAPINVHSIKEQFAKTAQHFSQNTKDAADEMSYQANKVSSSIRENANLDRVGKNIGRALRIFSGIILLSMGISLLIGMCAVFIGDSTFVYNDNKLISSFGIADLIFPTNGVKSLAWISFITVFGSFSIFLLLSAIALILNLNMKYWKIVTLSLFSVGILGTISGSYVAVETIKDFKTGIDLVENVQGIQGETLIVSIAQAEGQLKNGRKVRSRKDGTFYELSGEYLGDRGYMIQYEESRDSNFHFDIIRSSQGPNTTDATSKANNIEFNYKLEGNQLELPLVYRFPKKDLIRGQKVKVVILIPQNKEVVIGQDTISFKPQITEEVEVRKSKYGYITSKGEYHTH